MAPTPKRRHSTRRTGKRRASKKIALQTVVYDKNTGKPRLAHIKPVAKVKAAPVAQEAKPQKEEKKPAKKAATPKAKTTPKK